MKQYSLSMRVGLAVLAALLALPVAQTASPVEARKRGRTVTRTFEVLGAIEQITTGTTAPISAAPYPSPLQVDGLKGKIRDVNLRLLNFSHSNPDDIQVLLVGPDGQTAIVMANVGGTDDVEDITLTLDDEAAAPLPAGSTLASGTFRPINGAASAIAFNAPAPTVASANAAFSVFDGANPNGLWRIFVQDANGPSGIGYFRDGWEIEITVKSKKKRR